MWTQIRSHIKGSIEAAINGGILPRDVYVDESKFNLERCRLERPQRDEAYDVFLRYRELQESFGWWDDCDRAVSILLRSGLLESVGAVAGAGGGGDKGQVKCLFDKVYVDEVRRTSKICSFVRVYFAAILCYVIPSIFLMPVLI